ncbi:ferredoxin [Lacisediminimonas profundi]|uniref:ferredoxin n=1 Tax=Lacisediminimonas profundi TaxID=2603856 RepID=UPI00124B9B92|nr:ferredoxin [Lacisediminimonas profundi]
MYVIMISKSGQFRTEAAQPEDMKLLEAWDYVFFGKKKAHFVIAELDHEVKVKVTDETESATINYVPSKFLPRFGTIEEARAELRSLTNFGKLETELVRA